MAIPPWVQKHQVLRSTNDQRPTLVKCYPSKMSLVLPIVKIKVYELHTDDILATIEGLYGHFQILGDDLQMGWEVVPSEEAGGFLSDNEWMRPGARVKDRNGQHYLVSAVMGTEVVMRGYANDSNRPYLDPGVTRMGISQFLSSMTPMISNMPSWACIGSNVRSRQGDRAEYTIRKIDTVVSSVLLDPVDRKKSTINASLVGFEYSWEPVVIETDPANKAPQCEPPKWLRQGKFIRRKGHASGHDFWVYDIIANNYLARVQLVSWVNYAPGMSRSPTISISWETLSFDELKDFELLDENGYPEEFRECSRCKMRGDLVGAESPSRQYRCSNGHTWSFECTEDGSLKKIRDRFDIIDS